MRWPRGQPWQVGAEVSVCCVDQACGAHAGWLMRHRFTLLVLATAVLFQPRKVDPPGGAEFRRSSVKSPDDPVASTDAPSRWIPPGFVCAGQAVLPHEMLNWKYASRLAATPLVLRQWFAV